MLGARTKQVVSYGRRNKRIINDNHDLFDAADTKKSSGPRGLKELDRVVVEIVTPPSRHGHGNGKKHETMPSPLSSPVLSHNRRKRGRENDQASVPLKHRPTPTSTRRPLGSNPLNISQGSSFSGSKKKARLSGLGGAHLRSPEIDVDIFVLDETGRRLSQERRVSKTNVQVNQRTILHPRSAVVPDSDSDDDPSPQIKRRPKRWPKVMNSPNEEDVAESPIPSVTCLVSKINGDDPAKASVVTDSLEPLVSHHPYLTPTALPKSRFWVEIPTPALPRGYPQGRIFHSSPLQPPRNKPRPLTPIRRKGPAFPRFPPSPFTDLDISLDLADLTLSSTALESHPLPDQPSHLVPLLDECGQDAPVEFSAFIERFPVHPIVRSSCPGQAAFQFQKIGEASYSEVFGIGDVVLKIIPIRDEECPDKIDTETPAPSDAKDILQEIIVTRALGEMCSGFVNLLKTYVVRGKYPSLLLDLWDEYNQTKGSEGVRPDMLAVSQVYAIIVLPNGGPDLEAYSFSQPSKTGWRQSCSLFWQISRALAMAESLVSFEHRDLHWGQILVKNIPSDVSAPKNTPTTDVWLPMDHLVHGVKATVIDLGLARMDARLDDDSTEIRWTPLDEEIFEGEGDYQFDIYRLMRKHNGGRWADFRPLSNVMWLHYLLGKLLKFKNLRPPRKTNTSTGPGFTERQCYDCLLKMETLLAQSMQDVQARKPVSTKAGRRKMAASTDIAVISTSVPKCAGDVVRFGETMGWI